MVSMWYWADEPANLLYRRTRIGQRVDDNQAAGLTANA
jgi:hypothetical protein